ncbi:MAG TPA: hypothetical protein VL326_00730, partial [Kofleriaceae bacterium]|nr:hypothetical protein [Kofleriaceae bacterium]
MPLLTFAACGSDEPPSPNDVRSAIHDDLRYVLTEGKTATQQSTTNLPSTSIFSFISPSIPDVSMDAVNEVNPDDITNKLENELFTDANYQGNGIYRVPSTFVCKETIYNDDGTTTVQINPDCAAQLDKIQLRIRVANEDEAIRFFIQVDANHDE